MLKRFEAVGGALERGKQMGGMYGALIGGVSPTWAEWLSDPATSEKHKLMIDNVSSYLADRLPEVLEEVRGIAAGAGISLDSAFLLSAGNALGPATRFFGCSSIALANSDVGPLLGKTDDGSVPPGREANAQVSGRLERLLALTIRPEQGYDTLCVTPVGTIWAECGINAEGLCIGTSSGHPERSRADAEGVPQHIIPRLVLLHCADVNEGVGFLNSYDIVGKGINIVLVDEQGNAAAVENTYTLHGVRRAEDGVVFATNHYLAPQMQVFAAQTDPEFASSRYFQNSVNRAVNLFGRFGSSGKELSFAELKRTLMDHHNPGAICQHPGNNDADMQTNFGAIFVSRKREMWLNAGAPCRDSFERYTLPS